VLFPCEHLGLTPRRSPKLEFNMPETTFNPKEPDEHAAPVVFLYIGGVVTWLLAVVAWVFYFRGYA
jgi:hypothetical protein